MAETTTTRTTTTEGEKRAEVEQQKQHHPEVTETGEEIVQVFPKTSDFYRTNNIPQRFENPDCLKGYGAKPTHPLYRTTSAEYGGKAPSIHTVPICFYPKSQKFSEDLGTCGMYRNQSLNTALDKTYI